MRGCGLNLRPESHPRLAIARDMRLTGPMPASYTPRVLRTTWTGAVCLATDCSSGAGADDTGASREVRFRCDAGLIRAGVLVFSLDDGRFEGGFGRAVSSSATVRGTNTQYDLTGKLRTAVAEGIQTHCPSLTVSL